MANKEIKGVRIKFRRDVEAKYGSSFVPLYGEICLVDTEQGLRVKIGDGSTTFPLLKYVDEDNVNKFNIIQGYYYNGVFYLDLMYSTEAPRDVHKVYIDKSTGKFYFWTGDEFKINVVNLPDASATNPGVLKIYSQQGTNTDGTITQKFFTEAFNNLVLTIDENDPECLVLEKLW